MVQNLAFLIFIVFLHGSHCRGSGTDVVTENSTPKDEHRNSKEAYTDVYRHDADIEAHVPSHQRPNTDPIEIHSSRLKLFEHTDTDSDGFVTRKEYVQHSGNSHNNGTDAEDLFMTYDRDNDGRLSEQEFVDQSSPWDVINECEFQVMQKCNTELDQSMNEANGDLDEPLCRGLQSYLDCVIAGKNSGESCSIEDYIISVKQTALVYRSSGLCPNLEIEKLEFEIEIDYEPADETSEYVDEMVEIDSESSSVSTSSQHRPIRALSNNDERLSEEVHKDFVNSVDRECSSGILHICNMEFDVGIQYGADTVTYLEDYRECVWQNTRHCGNERQNLLIREGFKIIAKNHKTVFQNELIKDGFQRR